MNTTEMIEIMKANDNGKNIQMRAFDSKDSNDWKLVHTPSWDWENYQYRVFIKNIEASYFEYLLDNVWKITDQRFADYQMDEIASEGGFEEYSKIDSMGVKQIEDTRDIE